MENQKIVKVGIGVMIIRDGKVLMHRRKGSHGEGELAFPGGHFEYMESFEECARRETREECGIEIDNIRFQFLANLKQYPPKHYVHIGLIADWKSGEAQLLEPEKAETWNWYDVNHAEKLFGPCALAFESYKTGKNYFDS